MVGLRTSPWSDGLEQGENDELNVVEGLLLAHASGHIVRHPYVNNQLNKLLARWAFRVSTGGGFRLPAFALMDDGYLFLKERTVFHGSDWIPEHKAIVALTSNRGLCVRYPIRMFDDLYRLKISLTVRSKLICDKAFAGKSARWLRPNWTG